MMKRIEIPSIPLLHLPAARECRIVKRLNRFVVLVETEENTARAHINNTGRLEELIIEGRTAYILPTPHTAKTDFRLFAVAEGKEGALFDTRFQMISFEKALAEHHIPWLKGCRFVRRDARLGKSLIDYLITCKEGSLYLEIKSAVLRQGEYASYPDCPTLRGQKHIRELTDHVRNEGSAAICFMAALPDVDGFVPDDKADPALADLLYRAEAAGVNLRAISLHFSPEHSTVFLDNPDLPVVLAG